MNVHRRLKKVGRWDCAFLLPLAARRAPPLQSISPVPDAKAAQLHRNVEEIAFLALDLWTKSLACLGEVVDANI